jgi:hypothetical protein
MSHPFYTSVSAAHVASIPGATALGACDIGSAQLTDGRTVAISWGRNLTKDDVEKWARATRLEFVQVGRSYEVILPDEVAAFYLPTYLTVPEVAAQINRRAPDIARACREGHVPGAIKIGDSRRGQWKIPNTPEAIEGCRGRKRGRKPKDVNGK